MTEHRLTRTASRNEILEVALRIVSATLIVGLLIVLPALEILGLA
jgi:hypothetical protein